MKRSHLITLAAIIAVSGLLFVLPDAVTGPLKSTAESVFAPAFKLLASARDSFAQFESNVKQLTALRERNASLEGENAQLRAELQTFRNLESENAQLREALKFQKASSFKLLAARVVAREPSSWWQYVTIDRGQRDGIEPNVAVITTRGLLGKVAIVNPGSSKIVLIGDENCRVSAVLEGTDEPGIVLGKPTETGAMRCHMTFLSRTARIEPGQRVYSSGLGGVFPAGLLLGEVAQLLSGTESGNFGLYREVVVEPAADLAEIRDVFVVLGKK